MGHRAPEFLPDGRHFLYDMTANNAEIFGAYVGSLDGGASARILPDDSNATYASEPGGQNGYLFFLREGTLMAIQFDARALRTMGEAHPVAENVGVAANNRYGAFSSSAGGSLAYWSGGPVDNRELVWMDFSGKRVGNVGTPGPFGPIALSPNEKILAVSQGATLRQSDIWLTDLERKSSTRFTFGVGGAVPMWTPDGASLIYTRAPQVAWDIARKSITGGNEEVLLRQVVNAGPSDISPDGKQLVYDFSAPKTGFDIAMLALNGKHESSVYLATPANERRARFSPDGKWMAYQSDESGRFQVYVQTIPAGGAKFQISTAGGTAPVWRRDAKELLYLSLDQKIMSVPVRINGSAFEPGTPKELFSVPGASGFAVTRDGQRFLANVQVAAAPPITVVTNWQAGLNK